MKQRMSHPTSSLVTRVTVSLPIDLFTRGEEERHARRLSRSAYVSELYRLHMAANEDRARIARYAAAYGAQPSDEGEDALTEASVQALSAPENSPS